MGLFSKKSSVKDKKDETKKKSAKVSKKEAEVKDEIITPESQSAGKDVNAAVKTNKGQAGMSFKLLLAPKVSEKAAYLASKNVYVFEVPVTAEKIEIAKAVQDLYGVKVIGIRTIRGRGKAIQRGRKTGRRNNWKKALVSVKKGQTIDLYEGV
ncbi:MAG: 50S ribosomal protein L23 [Patescibacteria group bacterium]